MTDDMMGSFDEDGGEEEYISEADIAEENGFYIDDDGNWIPMTEDMEEARYEARRHREWLNRLRKKYKRGRPVPAPKEEWPAMIAEWQKTEKAKKPWFHICHCPDLERQDLAQRMKDALMRHGFDFDEINDCGFAEEVWVDSPVLELLTEYTEGREDEILDTIMIVEDVPYRNGLPAPVYVRYMRELEEYCIISGGNIATEAAAAPNRGDREFKHDSSPDTCTEEDDDDLPF